MGKAQIVVLGAGPAGATVALGLKRLGEPVVVVGEPRRFAAVEGVSARVVDGLRGAGCERAVQALAPPSPRSVCWNGVSSEANTEHLIDRQRFDESLLADLEQCGITVWRGRIVEHKERGGRHSIIVDRAGARCELSADFLVEARGRAAPAQGLPRVRGRETVSLLQYWQGPPGGARSAVQSCADGWAWMARLGDGRRYLQITLDAASAGLPPKKALGAFCQARFEALEMAAPFIQDAAPVGEPHARTSTPVLSEVVSGENWIRVGDAAMAVDPLSGNGIFQALSSALQAPAVIATILHRPKSASIAQRFHQQRVEGLFKRFARIGRDFYALESRWAGHTFWSARRNWPDAVPAHGLVTPASVQVARMPVVKDERIVEADVVVTPDQPLGVWHLNGVELAPLVRALQAHRGPQSVEEVLAAELGGRVTVARRITAWMRGQNWVA